jgi:hypothetical protein
VKTLIRRSLGAVLFAAIFLPAPPCGAAQYWQPAQSPDEQEEDTLAQPRRQPRPYRSADAPSRERPSALSRQGAPKRAAQPARQRTPTRNAVYAQAAEYDGSQDRAVVRPGADVRTRGTAAAWNETYDLPAPRGSVQDAFETPGAMVRQSPSGPPDVPWQQSSGPGPGFYQATKYAGPFSPDGYGNAGYGGMDGYVDGDGYSFDDMGGTGDCGDCGSCPPAPGRGPLYVRGEYLLWWLTGDSLPPLVTTSPAGTPQPQAGVLGQPGTTVLFGDQVVNNTGRSGARLVAGWWMTPNARLEGEVFGLGGRTASFDQNSNGNPILARPFFNLSLGEQGSNLLAFPGQFTGGVAIAETSNFSGAGVHILHSVLYDQTPYGFMRRVDLLYGFRYLGLYENLTANGTATLAGSVSPGTTLSTFDGFKTSNSFYGANLGASMETIRGRWSLLTIGRMGFGGTAERVTISGSSTVTTASGATSTSPGGLLAMPTNIGTYSHGAFTLVPQLELKLAYLFGPNFRVTLGYDVLYWSRVVRPGQQVDLFVNPTQANGQPLVGTIGPLFGFRETALWAQGLSTGIELRF